MDLDYLKKATKAAQQLNPKQEYFRKVQQLIEQYETLEADRDYWKKDAQTWYKNAMKRP